MAIIFAIIALVGWGAGDIFLAIASKKIGDRKMLFFWMFFSFILSLLYLPFAPAMNDWRMFGVATFSRVLGLVGVFLYFRAFEVGNVSLAGTIAGSYALVTIPLAMILFGERLNTFQLLGIGCILLGLILASLKEDAIKEIRTGKVFSDPAVPLALTTMVFWGIDWAIVRFPVERIGWYWAGFPFYMFFLVLPLIKLVKWDVFSMSLKRNILAAVFLGSLFTVVANYSLNLGITYGYSSIVAPIAGLSPVLFVILAHFFFKEKLTRRQMGGIVLSLLGIALISFSSG